VKLPLVKEQKTNETRLELARAALVDEGVQVLTNQSSGAATTLAESDGLCFIPAGAAPLAAGTRVDFLRWTDL
jgi:molybdopterin biosynthesis enzyme